METFLGKVCLFFLSYPQVISGYPSETIQDRFPIQDVGDNGMDSPFKGGITMCHAEQSFPQRLT